MTLPSSLVDVTSLAALEADIMAAAHAVPPLWPLSSSVAVNPFLGQSGESLAAAGSLIAKTGGVKITMPRDWYAAQMDNGEITDDDLQGALDACVHRNAPTSVAELKAQARQASPCPQASPCVAEIAAAASGIDWPSILAERIGVWASAYFDEGQALWALPRKDGAYSSWRAMATHDLVPEILGLKGFAAHAADAPQRPAEAAARALARLGIGEGEREIYLHRLLMTLGGWAQYARYRLWEAELSGETDTALSDLLTIRLIWEEALYAFYEDEIAPSWAEARRKYGAGIIPTADLVVDEILQEACERAQQRRLGEQLGAGADATPEANERAPLHAAFCIDVRSEVFRRALETAYPEARTSGFAGFFGLPVAHHGFASDVEERRLPVLLNPGLHSCATGKVEKAADLRARLLARAARAWGRFKLAAVSSFAFVEATGPVYVAKLFRDAFGLGTGARKIEPAPKLSPELDLTARAQLGETVLRAMSLTKNFARIVLLAGHGANVVNNPHASALHCGACGGYAGDVNARLLAALLNDADVRGALAAKGIHIPTETLFVAALHDTTTDEVLLYDQDAPSPDHAKDIARLREALRMAGRLARTERALRLPGATSDRAVVRRSKNWAEVRPEWALAGCNAFIAAPRARTSATDLRGQAFLHEYDWREDTDYAVLELILTAPVVVASWISLQYYGSAVAPELFGAGNKLLHNVTGGMGVLEGSGGLLQPGLPWQSVHDGEKLAHQPLRLSVCIEAPTEAMSAILERHPEVRALFDNRWLHLFAMDSKGRLAWRYAGDLTWKEESVAASAGEGRPILEAAE